MEDGNCAEVCVYGFMMERGGFLEAAERRKREHFHTQIAQGCS